MSFNSQQDRIHTATVAGGSGVASVFLTSDGLTKGAGNTFLYRSVIFATGMFNGINPVTTAPFAAGWAYNTGTGLLQVEFVESKTTNVGALGGTVEGLEVEPNGTNVTLKVTVVI